MGWFESKVAHYRKFLHLDTTTFFNGCFPNTYFNDGFRVVQLAWTTDWEDTRGVGVERAACRNATIFRYVFFTLQGTDRTSGFCAQDTSGGGAAIAYALAQYRLSDHFDYVVIGPGAGVARMDYACDRALYTGPNLNLCPLLTNAPYAFSSGKKVNLWETPARATSPRRCNPISTNGRRMRSSPPAAISPIRKPP